MKKPSFLFTRTEFAIWAISVLLIVGSFFIFKPDNYLYLAASLVGATLLIYDAKGHILGQVFTIVFAILYAIISYEVGYYGEMITYVGMTGLVAVFSLISWIMHPSKEDKSVVEINNLGVKQFIYCVVLSLVVTVAFYFILKAFNTNNLILSTVSVFTSFAASYLTFLRSRFFALLYFLNDLVLIALWTLCAIDSHEYFSMVVCFCVFAATDFYTYFKWLKRERKTHKCESNGISASF